MQWNHIYIQLSKALHYPHHHVWFLSLSLCLSPQPKGFYKTWGSSAFFVFLNNHVHVNVQLYQQSLSMPELTVFIVQMMLVFFIIVKYSHNHAIWTCLIESNVICNSNNTASLWGVNNMIYCIINLVWMISVKDYVLFPNT